tara:strand:+ start:55 stop:1401 length:1347 start_codon:yes stop_codon:yes gene_type:complete
MNIKEVSSKNLFKEFEIKIPYEEIDNSINDKIDEMMPTVSMPGFRKGKAPLGIVKKKYEDNILSEVIQNIANENTKKLLEEKKLKPFRQPKVEIKKFEKNEMLLLSIKIDLEPNIDLGSFKDIELKDRSIELEKKKIDENYKNFIQSQKHYHKVSEDRPVKLSDKIIANISSEDIDLPDFLKSQKNIPIVTDSDYQVLPNISNQLIEKKVKRGDIVKLSFDLNEVLKQKNKKNVEFEIEIVSLEHVHEFKVTKEFLKKNNFKDENELQNSLKENLSKQYNDYLKQIQKKELMDLLDSKNTFDVPEGLLEDEFQAIWQRLENAKKDEKLDEDDKKLSEEQLKKRYKKIALRRVKLAVLMQHIANKLKITVSEKELTDGMINYASQYPGQEKQIFEYFKKNPSSVESIRGPIFEQKIVDHIISEASIKKEKINVAKFEKLQEETFNSKDI